ADSTRRSSSRTTTISRLSSTSSRPRSASTAIPRSSPPGCRFRGRINLFTNPSPCGHRPGTLPPEARGDDRSVVAKVLIVEDDEVIAQGMATHLRVGGFDPLVVTKGETGLARLRYEHPDVCVLDLMLPGLDGWRVIETARSEGIGTPIIVVSARGTAADRVRALE